MAWEFLILGVIAVGLGAGLSSWRVRSTLASAALGLPRATNRATLDRTVQVTMPDGVVLAADLYQPKTPGPHPVIVTRTAYGRRGILPGLFAEFFARRGYIVLAQDVRGTGDSGGDFSPLTHEKRDGAATLSWVKDQSWFSGTIGTFGLSYLGYTANAMAVLNDPAVKANFATIAPRSFRQILYGTGGFDLDTALRWAVLVDRQRKQRYEETSKSFFRQAVGAMTAKAPGPIRFEHLPVVEADAATTGAAIDIFQTFAQSADPEAPYWRDASLTEGEIAAIDAPTFLASAWHDTTLSDVLRDYESLTGTGKAPRLTIGSGPHGDFAAMLRYFRDSVAWFDHHLKGTRPSFRAKPVRFNILGTRTWIDAEHWPLPTTPKRFYLRSGGLLSEGPPGRKTGQTSYTYDPSDPTPALGGPLLEERRPVTNNAALEARSDLLVFTSEPFDAPTTIIGTIEAFIHFQSNAPTSDLFVRVNRVTGYGRSKNITDAGGRVVFDDDAGGLGQVTFSLIPTAARFRKGQRLRILIASGAHPRIARNLGQGSTQEQAFMTEGKAASITIHHSSARPSFITLPIAGDLKAL